MKSNVPEDVGELGAKKLSRGKARRVILETKAIRDYQLSLSLRFEEILFNEDFCNSKSSTYMMLFREVNGYWLAFAKNWNKRKKNLLRADSKWFYDEYLGDQKLH